ncbi:AbgT family transporter [Gilliamella sp. B2776]|uniref:AbgT family transporter n=1 Tax=unclassified Gilliamella TaxID=2685620 RepID=UPI00226A2898|nr:MULTISPECIES: AbgT family transporter [unclassified Gilliamella]MCX8648736.1 AbgT family transporter [Gilliamella sp. B2779]MCX8653388.1 AbgT family transporter [Gilliamella sp. B2737]MCX8655664.1 AbgT family transporter [Gilliamella sp. B2894]MCX8664414.1 AbgT family transporter [Gilliamella sp. B2887]MCX8690548.1 AbgT family transporter [Gilliamella sp. B2776]
MNQTINSSPIRTGGFLNTIERIGNKIPDVTTLFFFALIICFVASLLLSFLSFDFINPVTKEKLVVINMLAPDHLVNFFTKMVPNFVNFPPLGITIVATLGIGIAESSGYINILLKKLLAITPKTLVTPSVIFVSMICHIAADSAYVILMPVSAMMFYATGRHPLAGIAASFAGLAGGFSSSYTPSIIDPIMQGFTQSAAQIIDPSYQVNVLCNYFLSFGGTFFVLIACWFITDKIVEPRLKATMPLNNDLELNKLANSPTVTSLENRAFKIASGVFLIIAIGLILLLLPENSLLRASDGSLTSNQAPIMQIIVPLLFVFFAVPGLIHGVITGAFKSSRDIVQSMEKITKSLISFIVFAFFCAQFLYIFSHSQIGTLIAIGGAEFLKALHLPSVVTIFGVIILTSLLNVLITSASSKWAILAPIFVPMLMSVGISPELTQAAYRISSAVNVSTPMFAFYPLIIAYCQQYCKNTGVGTLSSMMIPYTAGLLIALTINLLLFWLLGLPIGFDSGYVYPPVNN